MRRLLLLLFLWMGIYSQTKASHIVGGEIGYRLVSVEGDAQVYRVTVTFYADCTGQYTPALIDANPRIRIYKDKDDYQEKWLYYNAALSNKEITQVCPDEIGNTLCSDLDNSLPGIKKFTFTGDYTLVGISDNWRFVFEGRIYHGAPVTSSGRSFMFNNVDLNVPLPPRPPGVAPDMERSTAHIYLEASLNNTTGPNNSPTFSTTPVPMYCLNKPAAYNLGAADGEQDELRYSLIPGKITATENVRYVVPFTAQEPLPTAPGDFSFDSQSGQMNFVPNQAKNCMVVYNVEEFRNGIKVGSSMREMIIFNMPDCNNTAPASPASNIINGDILLNNPDHLSLTVCEGQEDSVSFDVIPSDADGDNVSISGSNLPAGASLRINDDGTSNAKAHFSWSPTDAASGKHYFYITYTDDGCPIVASRTVMYTINVIPHPYTFKGGSDASCFSGANGMAWAIPENTNAAYKYKWMNAGRQLLQTRSSTIGDTLKDIPAGDYKVYIRNAAGCGKNVAIKVDSVLLPEVRLPSDTTLCNDIAVRIGTPAMPYEQYLWNTGETTCCITADHEGVYRLQVSNNCGTAEDDMRITYVKCSYCFFVPSAFSPNGDGRNDKFAILETCQTDKYQLQIFNRWGKLLYTTLSIANSWDGTINGQPAESGVYFYRIRAKQRVTGQNIQLGGDITLIR